MNKNRTINILSTSRTALILLLATLLNATAAQTAWAETPSGNWNDWVNDNNIDWNSADAKAAAIPQSDDGSTVYISTAEQLAYYAYAVNNDKQTSGSASGYYCGRTVELMADIDLSAHYWKPIGWNENYYFNGYFHGNGHVITGIHVNGDPKSDDTRDNPGYGLFGYLHTRSGGTSTITDLVLKDFSITASYSGNNTDEFYLGGLVGRCDDNTAITNCLLVNGSVSKNVKNSHAHIGKVAGGGSPSTATANYYHNVSVSGWNGGIESYSLQTIGGETEARAVALTISSTHGSVALGGTVGRIIDGIIYALANETVTLNTTAEAGYIASLAATGLTLTSGQFTMPDNNDGTITATISIDPAHFSQSGDTYTIHTATGWNVFCDLLAENAKGYFSGKTVALGANITVTRMAGGQPFTGTFDGQNHTLTLADGTADAPIDAQFVAPFIETSADGDHQPTFRNLTIGGTIYEGYTGSEAHNVGGLIGHLFGTVAIEHCTSNVSINATSGAGGFVGLCENSVSFTDCHSAAVIASAGGNNSGFVAWSRASGWNINFTGCLFDGKLLQQNGNGDSNGGFIGWTGDAKTVNITNCLCAPAPLANGETMASSNSATFARGWNATTTATNCYDTAALETAQGKATRTVTAGADVTIDAIALTGDATQYTVSGITAYSGGGLQRGQALYYGSGDQLSLTLSNTATGAPQGYQYGYTASAGTLSGTTLTMPDENVTISTALRSDGQQHEVSYMTADGSTQTAQAVALDGTETNLATGWYYVGNDISYNATLTLDGDVHLILADGKTMNVTTTGDYVRCINAPDRQSLHIYGQSEGTGTLNAQTQGAADAVIKFLDGTLAIHGGNVEATLGGTPYSAYAIHIARATAGDALVIDRGTLTATATANYCTGIYIDGGDARINGGQVAATGTSSGIDIRDHSTIPGTLTLSGGTLTASSFDTYSKWNYAGTLAVASGHTYTDGTSLYNSTTETATLAALGGKTLRPCLVLNEANGVTPLVGQTNKLVAFTRSGLTANAYSTMCLPFGFEKPSDCTFYEFKGVGWSTANSQWEATISEASTLAAHTPYIFKCSDTEATFIGTIASVPTDIEASLVEVGASEGDDTNWKFKGTYTALDWTGADPTEPTYGFSTYVSVEQGNMENIAAGTFVRFVQGASLAPFRARLVYNGSDTHLNARAHSRAAQAEGELPRYIIVRIIGANGSATAIGTLDTATGQLSTDEWYTLGGRRLEAKPAQKGIYIHNGKKVAIK